MLAAGSTFGRYRIERELGSGGMGHVYEAQDTLLRRRVALKVVKPRDDGDQERMREAAARLLREARAAAALRHPNAVAVFDVGETDGVAFIAMELVSGRTLASYMRDTSVEKLQKLGWLLGTARALAAAHRESIVHRDVKPENVMVCDDGTVKVLDFGIAKRTAGENLLILSKDGPASFKTAEGVVTGTPRYMSPEQIIGATIDGRADQFAWGVVAYELLSGIHPQTTTGTSERWGAPAAALAKIAPSVPKEISEIVMRALERWPEHRFSSMDDVVRALEPHTGVAPTAPAPTPAAVPTAEEATMEFDDRGRPIVAAASDSGAATAVEPIGTVDPPIAEATNEDARKEVQREEPIASTARTSASLESSTRKPPKIASAAPRSALRVVDAFVADAHRPTWRRMIAPLVGSGFMIAGLADMVVFALVLGATNLPEHGKWIMRCGWAVLLLAPLLELARPKRRARLEVFDQALAIRGARGMSQTIEAAKVSGVSLAPLEEGKRFSVLVMSKDAGALPLTIEVEKEGEAQAILRGLGVTHARALTGTIAWPVRRGTLDVFRLVVSITWRIALLLTWIDVSLLTALAFLITIVTGLAAAGLAFAPLTGPHLELTDEQLRIFGGERTFVIALRDLSEVTATDDAITLRMRDGESVTGSGDTIVVRAPTPRFSKRALSKGERAHLVAHVNAAAARARVAWT